MVTRHYSAPAYWEERLEGEFTLRGTGHIDYSTRYNRWLYKAKRRALRGALASLSPSRCALDVGSGVGWVIEELRVWGAAGIEGCDVARISVVRLAERFPEATFFQLELGREPVPRAAATYELVTMIDVAYHITDEDAWVSALDDLARVIEPGGHLVVTDTFGSDDVRPAAHVCFRSRSRWLEAAAASGLNLVSAEPLFRWLSRDRDARVLRHLPGGVRGPLEFALETVIPRAPHMLCATFVRM